MNGALTIGTPMVPTVSCWWGGNFFLGKTVDELSAEKEGYRPKDGPTHRNCRSPHDRLGHFSNGWRAFRPLLDNSPAISFLMATTPITSERRKPSTAPGLTVCTGTACPCSTPTHGFPRPFDREYCNNIWKVDPLNVEINCDVRDDGLSSSSISCSSSLAALVDGWRRVWGTNHRRSDGIPRCHP